MSLQLCLPPSKLSLLADDMSLYRTISSPADYTVLQSDIAAISLWVTSNHLALNFNKCCYMVITRKRSQSIAPPLLHIDANATLPQVNSVKYLGIHLSSDLSWSSHISNKCSKTRKLIGLMYRQFHLCNPETALKLYKTFVRPHLEYGSIAWDPHLVKDTQSLERTQSLPCEHASKIGHARTKSFLPVQTCRHLRSAVNVISSVIC